MPKVPLFEETFLPHLDAAYNLARWILGREQDAQDVVQEAYTQALKSFPEFRGGNPRAWLFTIVRNTAYNWTRRYVAEKKFVPFDKESWAIPIEEAPSESSHDARIRQLQRALSRLPAEFREVLVLLEIEGWSYIEIATVLQEPLGTVMSRLSRARRHLREVLTQDSDWGIENEM
jgi:RNA polymerase sigma-70 factor, ECF subfamily